jgi:hypothetical protein
MNEFVNFGKRGVDLPAGCRDLIDVLRRANRPPAPALTSCSIQGPAHIATHLPKLLVPGAKSRSLVITWDGLNYVLLRNQEGVITALTVIYENTHRERAVREVFSAAGLVPVRDEAMGLGPVRVLLYPLPAAESRIGELVSDLLRKGHGLAEAVRIKIESWEDDAS